MRTVLGGMFSCWPYEDFQKVLDNGRLQQDLSAAPEPARPAARACVGGVTAVPANYEGAKFVAECASHLQASYDEEDVQWDSRASSSTCRLGLTVRQLVVGAKVPVFTGPTGPVRTCDPVCVPGCGMTVSRATSQPKPKKGSRKGKPKPPPG